MDKLLERFNLFDVFTMLIPGVIITTLAWISLSEPMAYYFADVGNEKYLFFIVIGYFVGVIYQEIGTIMDRLFLSKRLYGGALREVFLDKEKNAGAKWKKFGNPAILNEPGFFEEVKKLKEKLAKEFMFEAASGPEAGAAGAEAGAGSVAGSGASEAGANEAGASEAEKARAEANSNSLFCGSCLDLCERHGIHAKSEKISIISEMSRSLFWGCATIVVLNVILILSTIITGFNGGLILFYVVESILLAVAGLVMLKRKARYEVYRLRIMLRAALIYVKEHGSLV
ncbi:MAG: hypothetical protein J6W66_08815 [Lachnospiraceae bacterium]|nr:hypothetical protein [Lachnospiraceae bacterium]